MNRLINISQGWRIDACKKTCMLLIVGKVILMVTILLSYHQSTTIIMRINYRNATGRHHRLNDTGDGSWVNFSTQFFRLYAYSAFYDDRTSLLSQPVIRIIAVSDPIEDLDKNTQLHCVLQYNDSVAIVKMSDQPNPVGFGWPLNHKQAKEYVYSCPTRNGDVPRAIGISVIPNNSLSTFLSVTVPKKPVVKQEFCICVQVSFGNLNPAQLVEWLELQKLLGVTLVGVYDLSISKDGLDVLKHYSEDGLVDLRKTREIFPNDDRHYLLQGSPVINDCIYRHMHEFRRIAVFDFDEFIMPRKHNNLLELMQHLEETYQKKRSPHVNYAFRNNYFFLDLVPDESIPSDFTILRYRKKVAVSGEGYSVKSIINPQACVHMHNHYCWGVTEDYARFGNTANVDPEIALNQHYKKCHFSESECQDLMRNVSQDDVVMRLKSELMKAVNDRTTRLRRE